MIILGKYDPVHVEEPLEITIPTTHKKEENSIYDILDSGKVETNIISLTMKKWCFLLGMSFIRESI